ncbi:hypothetical protein CPB86DRAFT_792720 [Serendipita vermifera]|nr:hypothetical protein CPB86DRAFT_792720 [Serendipita vermifera]
MPQPAVTNVEYLTHENKVWSAKKRHKKDQVKEILFDENARREFLTGFRKRKQARQEAGKAKALERERIDRLEARRERRKELAQRAAQIAKEVEQAYGGYQSDGSQASTSAKETTEPKEMEFEGEEQLATVTIVEEFDADELKNTHSTNGKDASKHTAPAHLPKKTKPTETHRRKADIKSKPKFRYETKAARKHEKQKQRARREEKASRGQRIKGRRR